MNDTTLQDRLLDLFARHDIELDPDEDGWLLTDGEFPAVRATWHAPEGDAPGRLDIDVVLDEDRRIEESYAGKGGDDAALHDALARFEQGALPVLLAACWYVTDERRLDLAQWRIGLDTWDVFAGRWVLHGADAAVVPERLDADIEAALGRESLTPAIHALRLFHVQAADGESRTEVLLDNQPWPDGARALAECAWAPGRYSAHRLIVLDVRDY